MKGHAVTYLWSVTDEVLLEHVARLVRVTDVLERLSRITTALAKKNLVSSGVLHNKQASVSSVLCRV